MWRERLGEKDALIPDLRTEPARLLSVIKTQAAQVALLTHQRAPRHNRRAPRLVATAVRQVKRRVSFSPYRRRMDAVDREELIGLPAEALMRDSAFRLHRRHWAADADRLSRPGCARPAS